MLQVSNALESGRTACKQISGEREAYRTNSQSGALVGLVEDESKPLELVCHSFFYVIRRYNIIALHVELTL